MEKEVIYSNNEALFSIRYMEETGGEPDVIMYDKENDNII
jgi:hypothetical protein